MKENGFVFYNVPQMAEYDSVFQCKKLTHGVPKDFVGHNPGGAWKFVGKYLPRQKRYFTTPAHYSIQMH